MLITFLSRRLMPHNIMWRKKAVARKCFHNLGTQGSHKLPTNFPQTSHELLVTDWETSITISKTIILSLTWVCDSIFNSWTKRAQKGEKHLIVSRFLNQKLQEVNQSFSSLLHWLHFCFALACRYVDMMYIHRQTHTGWCTYNTLITRHAEKQSTEVLIVFSFSLPLSLEINIMKQWLTV